MFYVIRKNGKYYNTSTGWGAKHLAWGCTNKEIAWNKADQVGGVVEKV